MIILKDDRKFLTNTKNLNQIVEFSKTFKAKLSIVNTSCKNILSLDKLAEEICDTNKKNIEFEHILIKPINLNECKNNLIFKQIIKTLRSKKSVDTEKIVERYTKKGMNVKNIHSQIKEAKEHIEKIGMTLKDIGKTKFKAV